MALYSKRLGGPTQVGGSTIDWITVPGGRVYVIKSFRAVDISGAASNIALGINGIGDDDLIVRNVVPASKEYVQDNGWLCVLHAGDVLYAVNSGGGSPGHLCITASGYDLSAT